MRAFCRRRPRSPTPRSHCSTLTTSARAWRPRCARPSSNITRGRRRSIASRRSRSETPHDPAALERSGVPHRARPPAATSAARPVPRTILIAIAIVEAMLIPLWRWLPQATMRIRPRQAILFGSPAEVSSALSALDLTADPRLRVIGWAGDASAELPVPYLGPITNLETRARLREVEEVICSGSTRERLDLLRVRGPRGFLLLASHADALLASSTLGWIGD